MTNDNDPEIDSKYHHYNLCLVLFNNSYLEFTRRHYYSEYVFSYEIMTKSNMTKSNMNINKFTLLMLGPFTLDINECPSRPCSVFGNCTNSPGSFLCHCNSGFEGDGLICNGIRFICNIY